VGSRNATPPASSSRECVRRTANARTTPRARKKTTTITSAPQPADFKSEGLAGTLHTPIGASETAHNRRRRARQPRRGLELGTLARLSERISPSNAPSLDSGRIRRVGKTVAPLPRRITKPPWNNVGGCVCSPRQFLLRPWRALDANAQANGGRGTHAFGAFGAFGFMQPQYRNNILNQLKMPVAAPKTIVAPMNMLVYASRHVES